MHKSRPELEDIRYPRGIENLWYMFTVLSSVLPIWSAGQIKQASLQMIGTACQALPEQACLSRGLERALGTADKATTHAAQPGNSPGCKHIWLISATAKLSQVTVQVSTSKGSDFQTRQTCVPIAKGCTHRMDDNGTDIVEAFESKLCAIIWYRELDQNAALVFNLCPELFRPLVSGRSKLQQHSTRSQCGASIAFSAWFW